VWSSHAMKSMWHTFIARLGLTGQSRSRSPEPIPVDVTQVRAVADPPAEVRTAAATTIAQPQIKPPLVANAKAAAAVNAVPSAEMLSKVETASSMLLVHLDRTTTHSWLLLCKGVNAVVSGERAWLMRSCFERWHPHHAGLRGFKALLDDGKAAEAFAAWERVGGAPLTVPRNVPKFRAAIGTGHDWDEERFKEQSKKMRETNGMTVADLEDLLASLRDVGPSADDTALSAPKTTPRHPFAKPWSAHASERAPVYCDDHLASCGSCHVTYIAIFPGQGPVLVTLQLSFGFVSRGCFPLRFDWREAGEGKLRCYFDCFYTQQKKGGYSGISGSDMTAHTSLAELHRYVRQWLERQLQQDEQRWFDPETGLDSNGRHPDGRWAVTYG